MAAFMASFPGARGAGPRLGALIPVVLADFRRRSRKNPVFSAIFD
jgi:hypothetical protein